MRSASQDRACDRFAVLVQLKKRIAFRAIPGESDDCRTCERVSHESSFVIFAFATFGIVTCFRQLLAIGLRRLRKPGGVNGPPIGIAEDFRIVVVE